MRKIDKCYYLGENININKSVPCPLSHFCALFRGLALASWASGKPDIQVPLSSF